MPCDQFLGALALWCAAVGTSPSPNINAEPLKQELLAEYAPAAKRLRDFYSHLALSGTLTTTDPIRPDAISPVDYEFYGNGDRVRIDSSNVRPGATDAEKSVQVRVADPHKSFSASRSPGAQRYVLTNLHPDRDREERTMRTKTFFLFAPYGDYGGITILDRLKVGGVKITSVTKETRDGENVVKVSYVENAFFKRKPIKFAGWFSFYPDKCWALCDSSFGVADSDKRDCSKITYGEMTNGIPLLAAAEYWYQEGEKRSNVRRFEVAKIQPGAVPEAQFLLSALGISDVTQEGESRSWLYLIVAGIILIAAAIAVSRLAMRGRTHA